MPYAYIIALLRLAFIVRRMLRSAHLALSHIRPTDHISLILPFQIDIRRRKYMYSASLGTARRSDLSTRHVIKHSPKGSGLMW